MARAALRACAALLLLLLTALPLARPAAALDASCSAAAPQYVAAVMQDSPQVFWRLQESSGTVVNDCATGTYTGTYNVGGTQTKAAAGRGAGNAAATAVEFTGAGTGELTFTSIPSGFMQRDWTLEMFLQPGAQVGQYKSYFVAFVGALHDGGNPTMSAMTSTATSPGPYPAYLENWTTGCTAGTCLSQSLPPGGVDLVLVENAWHHLVFTAVRGTTNAFNVTTYQITVYINGASVFSVAMTNQFTAASKDTWGGSLNVQAVSVGWSGDFVGKMAEVAVYRTALSAARVQAHYACSLATASAATCYPSASVAGVVLNAKLAAQSARSAAAKAAKRAGLATQKARFSGIKAAAKAIARRLLA